MVVTAGEDKEGDVPGGGLGGRWWAEKCHLKCGGIRGMRHVG